jgi:hypothetical protein
MKKKNNEEEKEMKQYQLEKDFEVGMIVDGTSYMNTGRSPLRRGIGRSTSP